MQVFILYNRCTYYYNLYNDYQKNVQFSFRMSKIFLYGFSKKNHWKKTQKNIPIIDKIKLKNIEFIIFFLIKNIKLCL